MKSQLYLQFHLRKILIRELPKQWEVDDILCLSHKGDDNSLCIDRYSSEYEIDLASDMDEYEEIPTVDEDDNNVIDNAEDYN